MPRSHDESILEGIWKKQVVELQSLQEASVLSQFFTPEGRTTEHLKKIHKEIGINADTAPIVPISAKTVSGTELYTPRGNFNDKNLQQATWIRKQDEIQDLLQSGDGLFVYNPTTKTRVIIRQKLTKKGANPEEVFQRIADKKARKEKITRGDVSGAGIPTEDPYLQPKDRELRHLPFITTYNIWIFNEDGSFRKHELRHLTGQYEDERVKPDIESNLWVSYMDRDARAYRIPNSAFRGKLDEPPVPGSIGLHIRPDVNPTRASLKDTRQLADEILTKYGKLIKSTIKKALVPLGEAIKEVINNEDVPEDLLRQVMDDLFAFRKLANELDSNKIVESLEEFLTNVLNTRSLRSKYNLEEDMINGNIAYFKPGKDESGIRNKKQSTEPKLNLFVRDFILQYMKKFSPKHFEQRFSKYTENLF